MTTQEIEIIVTAKVEKAIKQFEKIVPSMKQSLKQVQQAFEKIDTKVMNSKIQKSVQFIKTKFQDLKKGIENKGINLKLNNQNATKQTTQIQKQISSLQKKISSRTTKNGICKYSKYN